MTISHGKGDMYFSIFFFLVLKFFAWKIVILKEWKKFITIQELPSSALNKQNIILNIGYYSQTYRHQPIYGTIMMKKVMKKSQYQMIVLCIQMIFVLSYQTCGMKGSNILILIMLLLVGYYV